MSVKQVKGVDVLCPQGHRVSICKNDWEYEIVETKNKFKHGIGIETHHQFSVDGYSCPQCGAEIDAYVDVWEYPNGSIETTDKAPNVLGNISDSFAIQMD